MRFSNSNAAGALKKLVPQ